ncbi:MAG: PIG-L domain-containing protein [Rhizobiales bacterium]|nr:PIG-L domain-containing protein [Hyphomicrobiales bacterium]
MRVLALGAHPDDIEIFMFGTLAAFATLGAELVFAIATDGAMGGQGDRVALAEMRAQEARRAAGLLGVEPRFLALVDGGLVPDPQLVETMRRLISDSEPDLILTHDPNDYHADHRALSQAIDLAASFRVPVAFVDTLNGTGFAPSHYVDISAHFALKRKAILCHTSQNPQRFVAMVELQNRFRSAQCYQETGYAEAVRFASRAPFADIRDLLPPAPPVRSVFDRGGIGGGQ